MARPHLAVFKLIIALVAGAAACQKPSELSDIAAAREAYLNGQGEVGDALMPARTVSVTPAATSSIADNANRIKVTATVLDINGHPLPGQTVNFAATGAGNTWSQASAIVDCSGVASSYLYSSRAQVKNVTASSGAARSAPASVGYACPGTFSTSGAWPRLPGNAYTSAIGDLNRDGVADVVTALGSARRLAISLGYGNGVFAPATTLNIASNGNTYDVVLADLNKDSNVDILATEKVNHKLNVYLGNGNGTFAAGTPYVCQTGPRGILTADFNRDGNLDVATANTDVSSITVFFGNGSGTLAANANYVTGNLPQGLVSGDFNNDGNVDIATANFGSSTVSVFLNVGDGTFLPKIDTAVGSGPYNLAVGNYNRDGNTDLVTANWTGTSLSALSGTGDGNFVATTIPTSAPWSVALPDLNGDGNLDLVYTNQSVANRVNVKLGDGNGTFATAVTYTTGGAPYNVAVADITGDKIPDVLTPHSTGTSFGVFLGKGDGTLVSTPHNITSSGPTETAYGDFNADGNMDIAVATVAPSVDVFLGRGDGAFGNATAYTVGSGAEGLIAADLNKDGRADLVSTSNNGSISVLINNGSTFNTPVAYTAGTYARRSIAVDVNQDGNLDIVTANWTAGTLTVFTNNGSGVLTNAGSTSTGANPIYPAAGKLNADNYNDIVVANYFANTVTAYLGTGSTTLTNATTYYVPLPHCVRVGDVNGDGNNDIAATSDSSPYIYVFLNPGNGSFPAQGQAYYTGGTGQHNFQLADINGDGALDVHVASVNTLTFSTLYGNGDGSFGAPQAYATRENPGALTVVDLNKDGYKDMVTSCHNANTLMVSLHPGCANYSMPLTTATQSKYTADANVSFTANTAGIAATRPSDSSNTDNATASFTGASGTGIGWDNANAMLRLGNSGSCDAGTTNCTNLDASWTPGYASLIGYWPLDGSGTLSDGATIAGAVGPNLAVTTLGSPSYVLGQIRQGLSFPNNSNTYLSLPAQTPNTTSVTVIGWARISSYEICQRIFDFGALASTSYFYLSPNCATNLRVTVSASSVGGDVGYASDANAPLNAWNHYAVTLDGNYLTLYQNGAFVGRVATALTMATLAGANNHFGKSKYSGGDRYFTGAMDELALFGAALNANQIALIYNRQSPAFGGTMVSRVLGPQSSPSWQELSWTPTLPFHKAITSNMINESNGIYTGLADSSLDNNMLFLWHFDEAVSATAPGGLDAYDDSGNGLHGAAFGSPSFGRAGVMKSAMAFPAGAGVSTLKRFNNPQTFSLSAWFNSTVNAYMPFVSFGATTTTGSGCDRMMGLNGGDLFFYTYDGSGHTAQTSGKSYNDGRWHHAVVTYSGGISNAYVDGVLVVASYNNGAAQSYAGHWHAATVCTTPNFSGRLDEVAVWDRVLSASNVLQLYRRGANRARFQVRACTASDCSDNPGWLGPDGTAYSWFSETHNTTVPATGTGFVKPELPLMSFGTFGSLSLPSNNYLQYRLGLESDDRATQCNYSGATTTCSPEIKSVHAGIATYPTSATLTTNAAMSLSELSSVSVSPGANGCAAGTNVALSKNGSAWYYYTGGAWASSDGTVSQSTALSSLNQVAFAKFTTQLGAGSVYFRLFLTSSGAAACSLGSMTVSGAY